MKTLKQVETITGIKADNLRQRIARGTLKAVKKGRDLFVSETELVKLLKVLISRTKIISVFKFASPEEAQKYQKLIEESELKRLQHDNRA